MEKWAKASYGKSVTKGGGGKLKTVMSEGNKGIYPGTSVPKASTSRLKGIDSPMTAGNKGVTTQKGFPGTKSPRD